MNKIVPVFDRNNMVREYQVIHIIHDYGSCFVNYPTVLAVPFWKCNVRMIVGTFATGFCDLGQHFESRVYFLRCNDRWCTYGRTVEGITDFPGSLVARNDDHFVKLLDCF